MVRLQDAGESDHQPFDRLQDASRPPVLDRFPCVDEQAGGSFSVALDDLAVDPAGESVNVNALDEVRDSSWFTNRIGRFPMTPEQVRRGPCQGPPLDPNSTWTVAGAKPKVGGDHAAKWETSYLWYLRPDCVDMSVFLGREDEELIGVGGIDPRKEATVEVGRKACDLIVDGMVRKAKQLIKRAT